MQLRFQKYTAQQNYPWNLVQLPEDYKYSSAKFYETGIDDPIAIGFGLLTHYRADYCHASVVGHKTNNGRTIYESYATNLKLMKIHFP